MPKAKNKRKKPKRRSRDSSAGKSGGGSMLALRSTMKRAAGAVKGADSEPNARSGVWSTVLTVALIAAAAAVIYFRFLR